MKYSKLLQIFLKQDQLNFPFLDLPTEAKGKGGQGINYYAQL